MEFVIHGSTLWGTSDLVVSRPPGVTWCTCLNVAANLTPPHRRTKRSAMCDSWTLATQIWGNFDRVVSRSFSGYSLNLCQNNLWIIWTQLAIQRNRMKNGTSRPFVHRASGYRGTFTSVFF